MLSVDQLEDKLIDLAFAEDIGDGDHTTLCCIPDDAMGKSHLLIKEDGVLAGVEMAKKVFARFDPTMKVEVLIQDGTPVKKGDIAMIVTGKTRSLLQTERLMLNIMQRMSGIATMTAKYVKRLEGTKTHILDTRKTTPGLRMLEKQAVKIGGGMNHRIGLFDMILLKDNHIDFCGGVHNAISRAKAYCKAKGKDLKIECEVRNWKELGGQDAPIVVISRDTSSGTFESWQELVMKKERVTPAALMQASNGTVVQAVAKNKNAIGYIGLGYLDKSVKGLTVSKVAASAKTALDGEWPIARELYIFTNGDPKGGVKKLVDYLLAADKGQKDVLAVGYVPLQH